jgi:hypothetical protein
MTLFFLHLLGLLIPGFWLGHRLGLSTPLRVGLLFLIFEASLIASAGLLSCAGVLGHLAVYQLVTTFCAFAIAFGLWLAARRDIAYPTKLVSIADTSYVEPVASRFAAAIGIGILVAFAAVMLHLTLSAYPSVEDSLTVKLPKVVFAIQANSILPTNLTDESRMYISPVYPALVQLFLIINGQNGHALLVFGFVNWIVCGLAIYQLCRDIGASKSASWIVVALVLLSPVLVAQGTSEGDDLMAATPLMISLMFLSAWLQRGGYLYPILAGLGLGFAVGFKFLALFFVPALPIILLFAIIQCPWSQIQPWLRSRWSGVVAFAAAFVVALAPHLIANWASFGNPFYVSSAVAATRNAPFNLDCGLRNVVGYTKNLVFSDFTHLLHSSGSFAFDATPVSNFLKDTLIHIRFVWRVVAYIPDFRIEATWLPYADSYERLVAGILPYNPTVACSAYAQAYNPTRNYITDNTLWYGVFGPLLLVAAFVVAFTRERPLFLRLLGLGFLVWVIAFSVSQKYLWDIGRYWSVAVLAGSPTVAILIDLAIRRGNLAFVRRSVVVVVGLITAMLAATVLADSGHRSIYRDEKSRYVNGFSPQLRTLVKSAPALNVRVAYGMDTYDYYVLMSRGAKLTNLVAMHPGTLNLVIVRPAGLVDNIYEDPRIPVRMKRPFAGGFAYLGRAYPQPGYFYSLAFVNNAAIADAALSAKSRFLLFEPNVRVEKSGVVGTIAQVADDEIASKVRYKIGWRGPDGALVMNGDWLRGRSAEIKIPAQPKALVVQAAIDGSDNEGTAEWQIRGFDPAIAEALDRE